MVNFRIQNFYMLKKCQMLYLKIKKYQTLKNY